LNNKANPNIPTICGIFPLYIAAQNSKNDLFLYASHPHNTDYVDVVKKLLSENANPEQGITNKSRPLHIASMRGYRECVIALLVSCWCNLNLRFIQEANADVNARTQKNRKSPLHMAAFFGHADIVNLLTEHGADLEAKTKDGKTPYDLAIDMHEYEIAATIKGLILQRRLQSEKVHTTTSLFTLIFLGQCVCMSSPPFMGELS